MPIRQCGGDTTPRRALEESLLDEIGLEDVFDRVAFFADGGCEVVDADRAAGELGEHRLQELAIHDVETGGVDVEHRQRGIGDLARDLAVGTYFCEVADAAQQAAGEARRAARPPQHPYRAVPIDGDAPP